MQNRETRTFCSVKGVTLCHTQSLAHALRHQPPTRGPRATHWTKSRLSVRPSRKKMLNRNRPWLFSPCKYIKRTSDGTLFMEISVEILNGIAAKTSTKPSFGTFAGFAPKNWYIVQNNWFESPTFLRSLHSHNEILDPRPASALWRRPISELMLV